MSDHLEAYFDAWNESDVSARSVQLNKCVTSDIELVHPTWGRVHGVEDLSSRIADFQSAYPGARVVRTTAVDEHNGIGRYGWASVAASGSTLAEGLDVTEQDPQGRLRRILLFHGQLAHLR
jgi:hypothetical protein